jgi:hypothetical protein
MKAVVYTRYGSPDVLAVQTGPPLRRVTEPARALRHARSGHRSASPARTPAVRQADDLPAEGDSAGIRPRHHPAPETEHP